MDRQKCEVWTRTMGYFRPISNFNLGKKSEALSRKHFNEKTSMTSLSNQQFIKDNMHKYLLMTTTSCPKCPAIKAALIAKLKQNIVVLDETDADFQSIVEKYKITQAPTLLDVDTEEIVNYEDILKT